VKKQDVRKKRGEGKKRRDTKKIPTSVAETSVGRRDKKKGDKRGYNSMAQNKRKLVKGGQRLYRVKKKNVAGYYERKRGKS